MNYLILGGNGMAGHLIAMYLQECGENVTAVARHNVNKIKTINLEATNWDDLKSVIICGNYDVVINCIGILNKNAEDNVFEAIKVNAYLPHFVMDCCNEVGNYFIHLSTDCVFSGKKGNYDENDIKDGVGIYSLTKNLGEIVNEKALTIRTSIIGPEIRNSAIGLFDWFMHQSGSVYGYTKSIWSGVTTISLAEFIYKITREKNKLNGIIHLTNGIPITKYNLLLLIKKVFYRDIEIIKTDGIVHDKSLKTLRKDIYYMVDDYMTQIEDMYSWIKEHSDMYTYDINEV